MLQKVLCSGVRFCPLAVLDKCISPCLLSKVHLWSGNAKQRQLGQSF